MRTGWRPTPRFPLRSSKFARILEPRKDKDVLDCGCVGSCIEAKADMASTSNYRIADVASRCFGVGIDKMEITKRRSMDYDERQANAKTMNLGTTFDAIVVVDLIEHVSSAGAFLEWAIAHLRPGGFPRPATPNPRSANAVLKSLAGIETAVIPEHTSCFDPATHLPLLGRHGYEPVERYWQEYQRNPLATFLTRLRPNLSAHFVGIVRAREVSE